MVHKKTNDYVYGKLITDSYPRFDASKPLHLPVL